MRKFFLFTVVLLFFVASGVGFWYWHWLNTPSAGQGSVLLVIPKGSGVRAIGELLAEKKLLQNDIRFLALVYMSGRSNHLRAGEYSIPFGLRPDQVLRILAEGQTVRHFITIPEGLSMEQIAAIFAAGQWADKERFLELAQDQAFIHGLGLKATSLEGYLFPETYALTRFEVNEEKLLAMMVKRFLQVWSKTGASTASELDRHQLITLASIVEKEARLPAERPVIAGVFFNRLKLNMRLQSDPTVSYGIAGFTGPLTKADLRRPTPYNTYVIHGLPPGPICNPGQASIEAVLRPETVNFLYFVARNDGSHVFSATLAEHNRAVQTYQRSGK